MDTPAFNVGDIVQFVGVSQEGHCIPSWRYDSVAPKSEFQTNGSTYVGKGYIENNAVVTWVGVPWYMVEYEDRNRIKVRLAFAKSNLKLVRTTVDSNKIDFTKLDRIIIEDQTKSEIISVLKQHKNAAKLFEEWGLGEIMEYGKGMTFMFYGPPGTGKTGMAHAIAKALGTELSIISAAEIQSSEPGGANRNIQMAFGNAKANKQVLFIDECDSLITNRSDLGMILASEVNTLLTEIEKFEGVCILATNRIEHMDEALERRISLIVEFPHPNQEKRLAIWKTLLSKKMPLADDVNIEELSVPGLSGGQIKNVILSAARLALAAESLNVNKFHFDTAIARIKVSKNLMGSASRYHQGVVSDIGKGSSRGRDKVSSLAPDKDLSDFLEREAKDVIKEEDKK